ncbi:helix-turn-helix domain-containing protein [Nonomuraea fuscirosea]|uniref:helix-turn-helix domain-containing protein n=1 Tax=Nonomuraea fuscirosea TaxID=1291556 RepID=UPI0033EB2008
MRYGQRGGYTPAEQERRERLQLQAAGWFEDRHGTRQIAREVRVHERTVARWRMSWREGGIEALRSQGAGLTREADTGAVGTAGDRAEPGPAGARVRR